MAKPEWRLGKARPAFTFQELVDECLVDLAKRDKGLEDVLWTLRRACEVVEALVVKGNSQQHDAARILRRAINNVEKVG